MKYPDYNTYMKLYGRYLTKPVERFFDRCNLDGKRVLDLCAGGGQLSQHALDMNAAEVVMVDKSAQMLNPAFYGRGKAVHIQADVEEYFGNFRNGNLYEIITDGKNGMKPHYVGGSSLEQLYDLAVCRQGINYWFNQVRGDEIANVIKPGGWLVFNTFGHRPSETPRMREYFHEGRAYKEISYRIGDVIHHVQTMTGMEPHVTSFDWIPQADYRTKLSAYFDLAEVVDGPSSMWYCQRLG